MQFDDVEAEAFGVSCGVGIGLRHVDDFSFAGLVSNLLAGERDARGAIARRVGEVAGARLAAHALVPDLRTHLAAGGVNGVNHLLPSGQRFLAPEQRDVGVVRCALAARQRPFRQDEPDICFGAAAVVGDVVLVRERAGRLRARHRGHDDAVLELHAAQGERAEERRDVGHADGPRSVNVRSHVGCCTRNVNAGGLGSGLRGIGRRGKSRQIPPPAHPQ